VGNDARPPGRLIECFAAASADFARRLGLVGPGQWAWATPCPEWDVRHLANHMTRGNLNYALLAHGGSGADFLRLRDADALGTDPAGSYASSVRTCAAAFAETGVLDQSVDYPLGEVSGRQALAIRIADTVVHTWDLARATGTDDQLDTSLVTWIDANVDQIYAGLPETPVAPATSHRFFAAPEDTPAGATRQDRLLHLMGRTPDWRPPRVPSIG
jgi:uncharacterized protein (TIGR03086 family)